MCEEGKVTVLPKSTAEANPAALYMLALDKGADLDRLEKIMEMKLKWEANEARKAYTEAMSKFKKNPPDIEKDQHVKFKTDKGMTEYKHASLANVCAKINAGLSKFGLSASWTTFQDTDKIKVTCKITHSLGHSEETSLEAKADLTGNKNPIQAIGSTVSYLERYTILALTGLSTREMDDDGAGAEEPPARITEKQKSTIIDYLNEKNIPEKEMCLYAKVERIEDLDEAGYNKVLAVLRTAKVRVKK